VALKPSTIDTNSFLLPFNYIESSIIVLALNSNLLLYLLLVFDDELSSVSFIYSVAVEQPDCSRRNGSFAVKSRLTLLSFNI